MKEILMKNISKQVRFLMLISAMLTLVVAFLSASLARSVDGSDDQDQDSSHDQNHSKSVSTVFKMWFHPSQGPSRLIFFALSPHDVFADIDMSLETPTEIEKNENNSSRLTKYRYSPEIATWVFGEYTDKIGAMMNIGPIIPSASYLELLKIDTLGDGEERFIRLSISSSVVESILDGTPPIVAMSEEERMFADHVFVSIISRMRSMNNKSELPR